MYANTVLNIIYISSDYDQPYSIGFYSGITEAVLDASCCLERHLYCAYHLLPLHS